MTNSEIVAQKGRETFLAIKKARKELPQRTLAERNALKEKIKELEGQWWADVQPYMSGNHDDTL
jgi:hypothetical protein